MLLAFCISVQCAHGRKTRITKQLVQDWEAHKITKKAMMHKKHNHNSSEPKFEDGCQKQAKYFQDKSKIEVNN